MKTQLIVSLLLLLVSVFVSHGAKATRLEIVCPCTIGNSSQTSLSITAGVRNIDGSTSGAMRFRLISHQTPSLFDSSNFTIGRYQFVTALAAGASFAINEFKTGLIVPESATSYFTLVLDEMQSGVWTRVDAIRMKDTVTLVDEFAKSAGAGDEKRGAFYFDGDPTIQVSGGQVTINLPAIVNNSSTYTSEGLVAEILQTNAPSVFAASFLTAASIGLSVALPPKTRTNATAVSGAFTEQSQAGFDYFILQITEASSKDVLLFQTVRFDSGTVPIRNITTSNIEVLEDSDGDGISNFNETLVGTNITDINSKPGTSTLDTIVLYTQGVPTLYGGDPSARIDQLIQVSNQVFQNSGLDIQLNLVLKAQKNVVSESVGLPALLDMLDNRQAPFDDLDALKAANGGDIVILLVPFQTGDSICGLGNLSGEGQKGDFASSNIAKIANTAVYADCDDTTMVHEIGHIMGLGHSRRQDGNDGGTFEWSVGYGVDNLFVTVMAYGSAFGSPAEQLRFASPSATCLGVPCGINRSDNNNGADAVLSLKTVQYQVERFTASLTLDTDNDGIPDTTDTDDDNDGVPDISDAFPLDSSEFIDTDNDGIGNNADTDDDGDGVPDSSDAFPLDSTDSVDTDGDGIGDNAEIGVRLESSRLIELTVVGKVLASPGGGALSVPANATAVSLNVTAVSPSAGGFITVWPCGVRPTTSNLNYVSGDIVPNGVIAPIGSNGSICFYSNVESDIVVDIAGWFAGTSFVGAIPQRLTDTRDGTGGIQGKISAGNILNIKVTDLAVTSAEGAATMVPSAVNAVALNVTVVNPTAGGFVTVYPCDVQRPLASNVNYVADQIVANGVIAPVSADGTVCIYSLAPADIIVDLAGWFPGAAFTPATPKRVVDTRDGTGGQATKLSPSSPLNVPVQGVSLSISGQDQTIPITATAAALNVTIVNPEASGFATIWPCSASRPLASNLNFVAGQVVANNVVAPIGDSGSVCFYTNVSADIVVDIAGYFSGATDSFVGSTPKRLVDSRDGTGPGPK